MEAIGKLIVLLLKLMAFGLGLILILGGGFCVLLPLEGGRGENLGFAAVGLVMAIVGLALCWALARSMARKDPGGNGSRQDSGELS